MSAIKVDHPAFDRTIDILVPGKHIVCFKVPKVVPTDAAKAFVEAYSALVDKFAADLAAIPGASAAREFGGHVTRPSKTWLYAKPAAEQFNDDEIAEMKAATLAAFPDGRIAGEWHNQSSGWPGYSIQIAHGDTA
jgi:hypothetical protein